MTAQNSWQTGADTERGVVQKWVMKSDKIKDSVKFEVELNDQTDSKEA